MTATFHSEIVSDNLLSHHCMTTLSLLLPMLLPLCVKLIFTGLGIEGAISSPRGLCSVWFSSLLLLPTAAGAPCPAGARGRAGAAARGRQVSLAAPPAAALLLVLTDRCCNELTARQIHHANGCFLPFHPQVLCPHPRTQRKITCSEVLCSNLYIGDSPCLLL